MISIGCSLYIIQTYRGSESDQPTWIRVHFRLSDLNSNQNNNSKIYFKLQSMLQKITQYKKFQYKI